ncbi:unnamed protein product, partial [Mesorhabditis spiculigera]
MRLKKKRPLEVVTQYGTVEGFSVKVDETEADVFLGVPYAKPPLGELRFRRPQPPDRWPGVLKCMKYKERSIQKSHFIERLLMNRCSEDCLYLNIFAPKIEDDKILQKYPVFFYIHGGGFMMDTPARYDVAKLCRQFVSRDVILVTIQYRLGFLGFFSTGDSACPGNMGMFDQVLALDWVRNNIEAFGGDPKAMTVGGQSAGAVSADLLSISPYTRGKFQRKMCLGGSSFCHWAVVKREMIVEYCRKKAEQLGWPKRPGDQLTPNDNDAMMDWLRTLPAVKRFTGPVYDGDFLPKNVRYLRDRGPSMRSLVGVGQYEALAFAPLGRLKCDEEDIRRMIRTLARNSKDFDEKEITQMITQIYGDGERLATTRDGIARQYIQMASDIISNHACWRFINYYQKRNVETYAYSFEHTSHRVYGLFGLLLPFHGASHGSEIAYFLDFNLFHSPLGRDKNDLVITKMAELTADYFVSFIRTGDPNNHGKPALPDWPVAWGSRMRQLDLIIERVLWVHELNSSSKRTHQAAKDDPDPVARSESRTQRSPSPDSHSSITQASPSPKPSGNLSTIPRVSFAEDLSSAREGPSSSSDRTRSEDRLPPKKLKN